MLHYIKAIRPFHHFPAMITIWQYRMLLRFTIILYYWLEQLYTYTLRHNYIMTRVFLSSRWKSFDEVDDVNITQRILLVFLYG